jgi:hypothetical protein
VGIRVCETLKPLVEVRDVVVAVELSDEFKKRPSAELPDELGYSLATLALIRLLLQLD